VRVRRGYNAGSTWLVRIVLDIALGLDSVSEALDHECELDFDGES